MKRKTFLSIACAALLAPLLFMALCAFALPAKYDDTYMGELKYKYARLSSTESPRIILVGGSAAAFGADSALLAEQFPDYEVINFGMYAALGSRMMLDLAQNGIREGDIVIFMPEINRQTLSNFTDGTYALQGLDGAWNLLTRIQPDLFPSLLGAMPGFAMEKLRCQLEGEIPEPGALYRRDSFNEYGDMDSEQISLNIMPEEYDPDLPVSFDTQLPTEEYAQYLNRYAGKVRQKKASLYYHFCPVNGLAVTGSADGAESASDQFFSAKTSAQAFYAHLSSVLDFPILGDPREAVMEAGWFYDTNFHLNRAGRTVFTRQLVRDLKAVLGDTSVTEIPLPAMPRSRAFTQLSDDTVLRRSAYAGNTTITEITVPGSIRRIEDGAFSGCTALTSIHIEADDPTGILIGRHLLDGTDAFLCVPARALSAYRTDYRFSQYADRIRGE